MANALAVPAGTLLDSGVAKLRRLCGVLGYGAAQAREAEDIFREMARPWGAAPVGAPAAWASDITDDHTPFEFSLAIDGGVPEIRFLIEVQGDPPSIPANWDAARAMNARLTARFGASTGRLSEVEDLFAPTAECKRFAMWHAVCFPLGAPPSFKVYLDPQARGWDEARDLVASALARVGLGSVELPPATPHDEICYFSLDLSDHRQARVKVYSAHYNATAAHVESAIAGASGHVRGQAADFCQAMADSPGRFEQRPVLTCLAYVEGSAAPTTGTVHFPVRAYARNDAIVRDRVLAYIHPEGASIYRRALDAFSDRRLEDGVGMQTYVSLREERGRRRLTVYLAPEVYDVGHSSMTARKISGVVERLNNLRGRLSTTENEDA